MATKWISLWSESSNWTMSVCGWISQKQNILCIVCRSFVNNIYFYHINWIEFMIWLVFIDYLLNYKSNLGPNLISSAFSNLLQRGGADRERRDGQQKEDCCDQFVRKVDHCVERGMMRRQNVSSNCLSHGVYLHKVIQLSFTNKLQNLHRFKLYRIMKDW